MKHEQKALLQKDHSGKFTESTQDGARVWEMIIMAVEKKEPWLFLS